MTDGMWDEPTDIGGLAEGLAHRPSASERDEEAQPFLNALVYVSSADKILRSGLTNMKRHSALARARGQLLRALDVIDAAKNAA
jgi:hypothetical protein